MTPQELQAYIAQYNTALTASGAGPAVNQYQQSGNYDTVFGQGMQTAWNNSPLQPALQSPQVPLNQFFNSDVYRLNYGDSALSKSFNPTERFENDPGVQKAIQAGMPLLANSYSQKGLGASGPAAKGLADFMYSNYGSFMNNQNNIYQSEYQKAATEQQQAIGTYLNQQQLQSNTFTNYQNQLAALSAQGVDITKGQSSNQFNAGQNLAQLLAQIQASTGGALSGNTMAANEILSQLLANQGVLNANAYVGLGSAMSQNIYNGSALGAQLGNAQNRSNAGTTNSLLGGIGASSTPGTRTGGSY